MAVSVNALLADVLRLRHPEVTPSWCAPLVREWRAIGRGQGLHPRFLKPTKRIGFALASLLLAASGLALSGWLGVGPTAVATLGLPGAALMLAAALGLGVVKGLPLVRAERLRRRLATEDLDWVVGRLTLTEREEQRCRPHRRFQRVRARVQAFQKAFAALKGTDDEPSPEIPERSIAA
jgi:hypothetical protein